MKKTTLQHRTLKLNKDRIADLQSGTILGGAQRGGDKRTDLCIKTNLCTGSATSVQTTSCIACPAPGPTDITY